ncbi:hypothetical protein ACHAW6_015975 [Cyclotella cf. meneghiniana]
MPTEPTMPHPITLLLLLLLHALSPTTSAENATNTTASESLPSDGHLPFHRLTVLASHNAHANRAAADSFFETLGINQENSIYEQLRDDGVRALLLDLRLDSTRTDDPLRLVHEPLDYGGFEEEMKANLVPFLEEDENAVVSLYFQTVGDTETGDEDGVRAEMLERLRGAFTSLRVRDAPLKELTFKFEDERWTNHDEWPTMNELREANQRLFVFFDRTEFDDSQYGFMYNQYVMQENDWRGIDTCDSRYMWQSLNVSLPYKSNWSRLFMMNHFCCDSGAESYGNVIPDSSPLLGGGDNGWGVLYPRIKMCMESNGGVKPNFIALDWVVQHTEARAVADFMNFGGALGTRQLCSSDNHCATSSCNVELGLCQCKECSEGSDEICDGCESGQVCFAALDGGLNECRNAERLQMNITRQDSVNVTQDEPQTEKDENFYCGEAYTLAVGNCSLGVVCPNGNSDCPADQVCFGPFECVTDITSQPSEEFLSLPTVLQSAQPSLPTLNSSSPLSTLTPSPSPSSSLNSTVSATDPPVAPVTMYCGETYETAKETCSGETSCPGGYECPSGQICFGGIKCFTRPPTTAPTATPTTMPPTSAPTAEPTREPTASPVAPTSSPTHRPTRAPFDFSNEYYCGTNFTDAQSRCYTTMPCPGGAPTVCADGETCYNAIRCIPPPSISPTLNPTVVPPTTSPVGSFYAPSDAVHVAGHTTIAPFKWEESSQGRILDAIYSLQNVLIVVGYFVVVFL